MTDPLLRIRKLSKSYGNLSVLDNISFNLREGEVLGLVGRRGAGKSTLINMIGGVTSPSSGTIQFEGQPALFSISVKPRPQGIELVHQSPQLVDQLDVLQN